MVDRAKVGTIEIGDIVLDLGCILFSCLDQLYVGFFVISFAISAISACSLTNVLNKLHTLHRVFRYIRLMERPAL